MQRIFRISLVLLMVPALSEAQDVGNAYLKVHSNLDGSLIFVDSVYAGTVGKEPFIRVADGSHRIGLSSPEVGSWVVSPKEAIVTVAADDTAEVTLDFPFTYRIDSVPFGAAVFREDEDRRLGATPLVFSTDSALRAALVLEKSGFATERIVPGTEMINRHSVALRPLDEERNLSEAVEWTPPTNRHKWLTYSALGLIAAGGALAVHFKFEADDRYDEYLVTADEATKDEVDRLDRLSYVALGGMQVGIGILAYRLAF